MNVRQTMHAAINFNKDAALKIAEVKDEIAKRDLRSEMRTLLVDGLKERAQLLLRRRQSLTQSFRSVVRPRVIALAILILAPNPV